MNLPDIPVTATRNIRVESIGNSYQIQWTINKFQIMGTKIQSNFFILDDIKIHFVLFFTEEDQKCYIQTTIYDLVSEICPTIQILILNHDRNKNIEATQKEIFTPDSKRYKIHVPILYSDITETNGFLDDSCLKIVFSILYKASNNHSNTTSINSDINAVSKKRRMSSDFVSLKSPANQITPIPPNIERKAQDINVNYTSHNSKEETGYIGLKNQGATCYMNSVLQSLFHIPAFRRLVFQMQTTGDENVEKSIPLNLQRLFCRLQLGNRSCSTKALTTSFGWTTRETIMQHDAQEFCRVLLSNLEDKFQLMGLPNAISDLFRGDYRHYIRCINVKYDSSRDEFFYDLTLPISDSKSLSEAFDKYVKTEKLTGDNQYQTDEFGKQDAEMGTEFLSFPKVLHIHLGRFEFDYNTLRMKKVNNRFEFPKTLDLSSYLPNSGKSLLYDLYGVLVHSGSTYGGHYYAFLRTSTNEQWFKFNDSNVTKETEENAIDDNFGDPSKMYSAYMLVYVKRENAEEIFKPILNEEIPDHLKNFLIKEDAEEQTREEQRRIESNSITVSFFLEEIIEKNALSGNYGFKHQATDEKTIMFDKQTTTDQLYQKLAEELNKKPTEIRIWETKYTGHPTRLIRPNSTTTLASINTTSCPSLFFMVQFINEDDTIELGEDYSMIYVKFFFPNEKAPFQYVNHFSIEKLKNIDSLFPSVIHYLGFPENTIFHVYHELHGTNTKILNNNDTFMNQSVGNGSILVFQIPPNETIIPHPTKYSIKPPIAPENKSNNDHKNNENQENYPSNETKIETQNANSSELNINGKNNDTQKSKEEEEENITKLDFIDYLDDDIKFDTVDQYINIFSNIINIDVYDLEHAESPLFHMRISSYLQFTSLKRVISKAANFDYNPEEDSIMLYKGTSPDKLPTNPMDTKKNLCPKIYFQSQPNVLGLKYHRLYFHLMKGINEETLENCTQYSIQFSADGYNVNFDTKVLSEKKSTCLQIFEKTEIYSSLERKDNIRFLQIYDHKISAILLPDNEFPSSFYTLRVDVVPDEHINLKEGEFLIHATHGYIDTSIFTKTKGDPFLIKVIQGEKFAETKQRVLKNFKKEGKEIQCRFLENEKIIANEKILDDDFVLSEVATSESLLFFIDKDDLKPVSTNIGSRTVDQPVRIYN
ncbi:Clan CA, family C19, ubiquitin hydrolase-like cysteine peptidase [Tritrichomonas foetus]|uniref:ubiquitinyl hydrolase 1 n=1 Tax=Tritrichomonas foetus TaxID=1144522 RepID=A0A1J4JTN2_9EUKA|nr:Clan CA, family C19, ubiquitin hydrolase-like cysteine peptidase [Tritrichomonas foetus]|eukprot:OHT00878.1 Clan CA, family C19, ubiquitin hydrolase-like cysteine peptidase [Tritrichomonas foetus]